MPSSKAIKGLFLTCLFCFVVSASAAEKELVMAPPMTAGDEFGSSVSVDGDIVVVGAPYEGDTFSESGAAYVFARDEGDTGNWGLVKKLSADVPAALERFGYSVSVSGDIVAVGAYSASSYAGKVELFYRNQDGPDNWGHVATITGDDTVAGDKFGFSVSLDGDTLSVGAPESGDTGAVYLFYRNQDGTDVWGQVKKQTAFDATVGDNLGQAVALSGDTAVAGAPLKNGGAGGVYIFYRNQGGNDYWGEVTDVTAFDGAADDEFGSAVSVSGDILIVGASSDDDAGSSSGSAYLFSRHRDGQDAWGKIKKLTASDAFTYDYFGESVMVDGDVAIVGAPGQDDGSSANEGAVYLFHRYKGGNDNWGEVQQITAASGAENDTLGSVAAIDAGTVAAGAPESDALAGTAYVFDVDLPPFVASISRSDASPTTATVLRFLVTFTETVDGIDTGDFSIAVTGSATGNVASVSAASGASVTVTVDGVSGEGEVGLNLVDNDSITDAGGNPLGGVGTGDGFVGAAFTRVSSLTQIIQSDGPVPDTGQTLCYNEAGTVIPCPGTGQDGEYLINPPSYTKLNALGQTLPAGATDWVMVRDDVTGLIWEVKQNGDGNPDYANPHDADNTYTWYDSTAAEPGTPGTGTDTEDFIAALNAAHFGGFDDWRMPEREELLSIVDYSRTYPAVDSNYFSETIVSNDLPARSFYWTSTSFPFPYAYGAWYVDFRFGRASGNIGSKENGYYVRAVRGNKVAASFVDNGDGTVTDVATGLMWEQKTDDGSLRDKDNAYTWQEAHGSYIAQLNASDPDYDDWRIPSIKELMSISHPPSLFPAVDGTYFPHATDANYWSSTTSFDDNAKAWSVYCNFGGNWYESKLAKYKIRAVRGGLITMQTGISIISIDVPERASSWSVGSVMPITWDPAGITGNVRIYYSPEGGKTDTFTEIDTTADPENDGYFEWTVSGDPTVNGVIKIEPVNAPTQGTTVGMFAVDNFIIVLPQPPELTVGEQAGARTATFTVKLTSEPAADVTISLNSSNIGQFTVTPSALVLQKGVNAVTGVTATVEAVDDAVTDGDYIGAVLTGTARSTDAAYDGMVVPDVQVTVTDDDAPPFTVTSVSPAEGETNKLLALTILGDGFVSGGMGARLLRRDAQGQIAETITPISFNDSVANTISATFAGPADPATYALEVARGAETVEIDGAVAFELPDRLAALTDNKAILVAGGGPYTGNSLWPATWNCANMAFRALVHQRIDKENILYLSPEPNTDVDGDGVPDVDDAATAAKLEWAITTWAADADELVIYLTGHGNTEMFEIQKGEWLSAADLRDWLDILQVPEKPAVRVIVVMDACMSGSFLPALTPAEALQPGSQRIVIAGSASDEYAYFLDDGEFSFSFNFWESVYRNGRLYQSFILGRDMVSFDQQAMADRAGAASELLGDGNPDEIIQADLDSGDLSEILIGLGLIAASTLPEIDRVWCETSPLQCETFATLKAEGITTVGSSLNHITGYIVSPDKNDVDTSEPLKEMPSVNLTDIDQDDVYEADYNDFSEIGVYTVAVFAFDGKDNISLPKLIKVSRTCGVPDKKGDINLDFEADLADAIIALKVLAGMSVGEWDIRPDYGADNADVDGDSQVALAEAVYLLQKAAGVR